MIDNDIIYSKPKINDFNYFSIASSSEWPMHPYSRGVNTVVATNS